MPEVRSRNSSFISVLSTILIKKNTVFFLIKYIFPPIVSLYSVDTFSCITKVRQDELKPLTVVAREEVKRASFVLIYIR